MDPARLLDIPESHRNAALERLTDYLIEHGADAPDAAVSVEIVSRITEVLEVNQRRDLAERFAHANKAPVPLIRRFACDNIVVAEPVLRWSKLITPELLEDIAEDVSDEHFQVVSQRSDLSEAMAEILIARGSMLVHTKLALNANLGLSRGLLVKLMGLAATEPSVEEALCGREDLPEKASEILMRRVSRRLSEEVGSVAEKLPPPALRLALRTRDVDGGAKDSDTQGLSLEAFTTITRLARSGHLSSKHLADFIRKRDMGAVITCFASLAGIRSAVARRLILQPSNEGLAIAARATGLDREVFEAIVDLKRVLRMSDMSHAAALAGKYDDVPVETAQQIMGLHSALRSKAGNRYKAAS